jgi:hypothetical protein
MEYFSEIPYRRFLAYLVNKFGIGRKFTRKQLFACISSDPVVVPLLDDHGVWGQGELGPGEAWNVPEERIVGLVEMLCEEWPEEYVPAVAAVDNGWVILPIALRHYGTGR